MGALAAAAPTCVYSPHPLNPAIGRQCHHVQFKAGESLLEYLLRLGIHPLIVPIVVTLNGRRIDNRKLHSTYPATSDQVNVRVVVQGGDGSNPLAVVLSIALTFAAPGIGNALAWGLTESLGLTFASHALVSSLATGVVLAAGGAIIRSLAPPPAPDISAASQRFAQASPTYALAQSSNQTRPYQPFQVLFGQHRMWPDKGARTYTEIIGRDLYIYEIYEFGLSDLELSDIRLGDTPVTEYDDVQIEISDADGQLSLGHGNVDTISGAEFRQGKPITRTTSPHTTRIGVDFSGQLFGIDKKGRNFRVEVNIRGRYRAVGSAAWSEFFVLYRSTHTHYWSRGFYNKGVWQQVETGPTDPRAYQEGQDGGGAFGRLGSGIAAQVLSQLPTQWRYIPFGTYASPARYRDVTAASITLGGSSRDTFRQSWYRDVPEGQYEVELTRLTKDHDGSNTTFSRLNWTQMRSYQPDTVDYTGRKRMALRGRASGQFQGAIQTVNAIARARIAYEDASRVMRYGYSDNPAWLFVHFAQGQYIHDRLVYGGGLATERLDIDGLREWGRWCYANKLSCNFVLDTARNIEDVLTIIANAGRATLTWQQGGKLGVIYDQDNQPAVHAVTMDNIIRNSFKVKYLSEQVADEIIVSWINPELGYKPDYVRRKVGNTQTPTNPVTIERIDINNLAQAAEEANLQAYRNAHLRRRVIWDVEADGLAYTRGDVVVMSHDLTAWDVSGHIVAVAGDEITLSHPVTFEFGTLPSHYIGIRWPGGAVRVLRVRHQNGTPTTRVIRLFDPWPAAPPGSPEQDSKSRPEDYLFWFARTPTPGRLLKIVHLQPLDMYTVRVIAVDEDPNYYLSKHDDYDYINPRPFVRQDRLKASISDFRVTEDPLDFNGNVRVLFSWQLNNASGCALSLRVNHDAWTLYNHTISGGSYRVDARAGDRLYVIYYPVGLGVLRGGFGQLRYEVKGLAAVPANVTGFQAVRRNDEVLLTWQANTELDIRDYVIRRGREWRSSIPVAATGRTEHSLTSAIAATYLIKARDSGGRESARASAVQIHAWTGGNLLINRDEHALQWPGTLTDMTLVNLKPQSGVNAAGRYTSPVIDLAGVLTSRIELDSRVSTQTRLHVLADFVDPIAQYADWFVSGPRIAVAATHEINTSDDNVTWDGWRTFVLGDYTCRYLQYRIGVDADHSGGVAIIDSAVLSIDVPDRELFWSHTRIATGGSTITFSPAFNASPFVGVTLLNGDAGDTYKITAKSKAGMTLQCFDASNRAVIRHCDIIARGY